ncbi:hypothetical protein V6N12_023253 [Hibiscus sabdariffa]|uniref:Auxin efflux carrier component n=1 Tax=Hibiscus sabdariffa TaxID=183260 RepID=A0ABR2FX50_9ROSI
MSNASPRESSFGNLGFDEENGVGAFGNNPVRTNGSAYPAPTSAGIFSPVAKKAANGGGGDGDFDEYGRDEFTFGNKPVANGVDREGPVLAKLGSSSTAELNPKAEPTSTSMPPASVMTRLILIMVWRKLIRNPNTYSSLIGLTWSLVSFKWNIEMPAIVARSISILSDAGLGMAMFSLAASIAVGLRGVLLRIAIVQAALPQGIVPFVFAKEYNVHPDILSTGVIFGMLIALPITLVYYILLGL